MEPLTEPEKLTQNVRDHLTGCPFCVITTDSFIASIAYCSSLAKLDTTQLCSLVPINFCFNSLEYHFYLKPILILFYFTVGTWNLYAPKYLSEYLNKSQCILVVVVCHTQAQLM